MKTLYIDESGTYTQDITRLDPNNPIFLVCGVIINPKAENEVVKEFTKLKIKFFQNKGIIFHSREFANPTRSKQPGIILLNEGGFRGRFYSDLNRIITKIDFQICGFVVHVEEYLKALKDNQPDPYLIGVETVVDIFIKSLADNEMGHIVAEGRSHPKLNKAVLDRWKMEYDQHGRVGLTTKDTLLKHKISEPEFLEKSHDLGGLELVDLIAYHFARGLAGKSPKGPQNEIPIELINAKMHPEGYFALPTHPSYYLKNKSI